MNYFFFKVMNSVSYRRSADGNADRTASGVNSTVLCGEQFLLVGQQLLRSTDSSVVFVLVNECLRHLYSIRTDLAYLYNMGSRVVCGRPCLQLQLSILLCKPVYIRKQRWKNNKKREMTQSPFEFATPPAPVVT
jgi:hypothetical protein